MNAPKVSVCIPVYNPGSFLASAIDSVLTQSFTDFELLVIDDASSQPVEDTIARYADSRLRFERNSRNLGLVGNWNRCLMLARGEYVTIFHQDDIMAQSNLLRKVDFLDRHSNVGFVYSDVDRISTTGDKIGCYPIAQPQSDAIFDGSQFYKMVASTGNPVPCPAVLARAECFQNWGGFDSRLPFATDLEMWLRLAIHCDIGYIAKALVALRVHPGQETARFIFSGKDYQDVLAALNLIYSRDLPWEYARYARQTYRTLGAQASAMARWRLRQGKIRLALSYGMVALKSATCAALAVGEHVPTAAIRDEL